MILISQQWTALQSSPWAEEAAQPMTQQLPRMHLYPELKQRRANILWYVLCQTLYTGMRTIPILTSKTLTVRGRGCCDLASGGLSDWFRSWGWFSSCSAGFCGFYEGNRPWADSVVVGQNAVYYSLVCCFRTWIRTSLGLFGGNTKLH